jgi:hypothetical protein
MLNARTAKTELKANGDPKDENVLTMLRLIDELINQPNAIGIHQLRRLA